MSNWVSDDAVRVTGARFRQKNKQRNYPVNHCKSYTPTKISIEVKSTQLHFQRCLQWVAELVPCRRRAWDFVYTNSSACVCILVMLRVSKQTFFVYYLRLASKCARVCGCVFCSGALPHLPLAWSVACLVRVFITQAYGQCQTSVRSQPVWGLHLDIAPPKSKLQATSTNWLSV